MAQFRMVTTRYIAQVCVATIEADCIEQAQELADSGEWDNIAYAPLTAEDYNWAEYGDRDVARLKDGVEPDPVVLLDHLITLDGNDDIIEEEICHD